MFFSSWVVLLEIRQEQDTRQWTTDYRWTGAEHHRLGYSTITERREFTEYIEFHRVYRSMEVNNVLSLLKCEKINVRTLSYCIIFLLQIHQITLPHFLRYIWHHKYRLPTFYITLGLAQCLLTHPSSFRNNCIISVSRSITVLLPVPKFWWSSPATHYLPYHHMHSYPETLQSFLIEKLVQPPVSLHKTRTYVQFNKF